MISKKLFEEKKLFFFFKKLRRFGALGRRCTAPLQRTWDHEREPSIYVLCVASENDREKEKVVSVHFSPGRVASPAARRKRNVVSVSTPPVRVMSRDLAINLVEVKSQQAGGLCVILPLRSRGAPFPRPRAFATPGATATRRVRGERVRSARRAGRRTRPADEGGGRGRRPPRDLSVLVFRRARR